MSRGTLEIFVTRPISAACLALALTTVLVVAWREWKGQPAMALERT
jgi:TctA family transporter